MTQEVVADLLNVHKRTVENDEKAHSTGLWERLNDYARIYNRPVEWFLWGDEVIVHDAAAGEQLAQVTERLEALVRELVEPLQAAQAALAGSQAGSRSGRARR